MDMELVSRARAGDFAGPLCYGEQAGALHERLYDPRADAALRAGDEVGFRHQLRQ